MIWCVFDITGSTVSSSLSVSLPCSDFDAVSGGHTPADISSSDEFEYSDNEEIETQYSMLQTNGHVDFVIIIILYR